MRNDRSCLRMLIILSVFALTVAGCSKTDEAKTMEKPAADQPYDSLTLELAGVDSLTVFEILSSAHQVDYATTASGVFIKAIDSVENSGDFFWVYSVNDSMAQLAADRYITADGDVICWHFRRMTP